MENFSEATCFANERSECHQSEKRNYLKTHKNISLYFKRRYLIICNFYGLPFKLSGLRGQIHFCSVQETSEMSTSS